MRLGALQETHARQPSRANGNHPLDDVKAFSQRVSGRVQERANTLLLVVVQHGPAHTIGTQLGLKPDQQHDPHQPHQHRRNHQLPTHTGKENDRHPGNQHQQRGAQIGLLHDQPHRHGQQQARGHKVKRAQLALAFLKPPGQHQRHGDFENFAGLDGDAHIQPAARTLFSDAKYGYRNQQTHTQHIQRHGQGH